MFKIIHTHRPRVGAPIKNERHIQSYGDMIEHMIARADKLIAKGRTFTYDPGQPRLDGSYASLPIIVANDEERWHVEHS